MDDKLRKDFYYQMVLIRRFEETVARMYELGKLAGSTHLYIGEEAVATGAIAPLRVDDYISSHHRGHGHFICKGADLNKMMAELFGKEEGYCRGKGGSMHIADIDLGHLGANGIVGGGLTIATGAALGIKIKKTDQIVVCFFGDGAAQLGVFHESLNLAGLWNLPIIYVIENNLYAMSNRITNAAANPELYKRAEIYNMQGFLVDGQDVEEVYRTMQQAVEIARNGNPCLIEARTYRFLGHSRSDPCPYRTDEEEEYYINEKDPIKNYRKKLMDERVLTEKDIEEIEKEINERIEKAVAFADNCDYPDLDTLEEDIYV